ncbi:MAG: hypothetical protein LBR05_07975 [Azoarcus sp.]|nr:hypothetical protein [Azoarcus sp.]
MTTIVDGRGLPVTVPAVPQGVLSGTTFGDYLESTHAPQFLRWMGERRWRSWFKDTVPAWIYSELLDDRYWTGTHNFEAILARDTPGALYFNKIWIAGDVYDADDLRRFGLMAVNTGPDNIPRKEFPAVLEKLGLTEQEYDERHRLFASIRVTNAALNQAGFGEQVVARYERERDELLSSLRAETIAEEDRPYVMGFGAPSEDWSRIWVNSGDELRLGFRDAAKRHRATGREQDAERILAMNPDVVLGPSLETLANDPRWRGLDAVLSRRVYASNPAFCGRSGDLDNIPACARWRAEIVHPDRLSPGTRQAIREHYRESYGALFEISEEQIDTLLRVEDNRHAQGYERFMREAAK